MQSGQVQEALALYQRAEAAVPRDPLLHLNYGVALGRAGDLAGATAQLEIARTLAPRDPGILFALGCQQAVSGKLTDAQDSFIAVIAIDPDHLPAHGNLAEVYRRRGEPALATQQYLEVLRLDPQNAVAREALGR
jgi:Flp pilus assembly protein TadD